MTMIKKLSDAEHGKCRFMLFQDNGELVYECSRELWHSDVDHCIFHSEQIEAKKEEFMVKLADHLSAEPQIIVLYGSETAKPVMDFVGFQFPDVAEIFVRTTFGDSVIFHSSVFHAKTTFRSSVFEKEVSFRFCQFKRKASFEFVNFHGRAAFHITTFSSEASFFFTKFRSWADFMNVTFSGFVSFQASIFDKRANFNHVKFYDKAIIAGVAFRSGADFEPVTLSEHANFSESKFIGTLNGMDFDKGIFTDADFSECEISYPRYTERTNTKHFSGVKAETMQGPPRFKRYLLDQVYLEDFRRRKRWGISTGEILFWIWNITTKCGRSFLRWSLWSMVIAIIFALLFFSCREIFPLRINPDGLAGYSDNFLTYVYYSVVTFTTLGFGDIIPKNLYAAGLIMAEVVVGYLMLGGLISILANKIARRS